MSFFTNGSHYALQWVQGISEGSILSITILGAIIAVIATIYNSLDNPVGVLRIILQIAIPLLFTIMFCGLLLLLPLFFFWHFHYAETLWPSWLVSILLASGMISMLHSVFALVAPSSGAQKIVAHTDTFLTPPVKKKRFARWLARIRHVSWRGAILGTILGAISIFVYWFAVEEIFYKINIFNDSVLGTVGVIILCVCGGILGCIWCGWIRPPLPLQENVLIRMRKLPTPLFHRFFHWLQSRPFRFQRLFLWLRTRPLERFVLLVFIHPLRLFLRWCIVRPFQQLSCWATLSPNDTKIVHSGAIATNTQEPGVSTTAILPVKVIPSRPGYFSPEDGKAAFFFWLSVLVLPAILILVSFSIVALSSGVNSDDKATLLLLVLFALICCLAGWFTQGILRFTNWMAHNAKQLGNIWLLLSLLSIILSSIDPLLHVIKPPATPTVFTYASYNNYSTIDAVAWSPNGQNIVFGGSDYSVYTWNPTTNAHVSYYDGEAVKAVAWSPDGRDIAAGDVKGRVYVWDTKTRDFLHTTNFYGYYNGHADAVNALAWSPDGTYIASAGADDTVQVWNVRNGNMLFDYAAHTATINTLAWSHNGKYIASAGDDGTVRVWNAKTGMDLYTYLGHARKVETLAWSHDDRFIASGSDDKTVQVWDALTGEHVFVYNNYGNLVDTLAWSPDNREIACGGSGGKVEVWNVHTGETIYTYQGHVDENHPYTVKSLSWSPDGAFIASASDDTTVKVWEAP